MDGLISFKRSRRSFLGNYILGICLLLLLLLLNSLFRVHTLITYFLVCVIFLFIFEPEGSILYRTYCIGETHVYEIKGILSKRKTSIPYNSIANTVLKKGVIGRLFNFGDIIISGFSGNIIFKGVVNPDEKFKLIEKNIEKSRE